MNRHPAHSELDQLAQLRARADKVAADAARWPALLTQAKASLAAAQATFLSSLDAKAAASVAEADANLRALIPTCGALESAGGSFGLRRKVLDSAEALAILATGFEKRIAALEALKPAARALYARFSAEAVAAGADPRTLVGLNITPSMRGAQVLLDRIDDDARSARAALSFARSPDPHAPRPFESLLEQLEASLPVVPAV